MLTKDQTIVTLDKNIDLNMEITVARGTGYRTANDNKTEDQSIDMLAIDSIFTPIKKELKKQPAP